MGSKVKGFQTQSQSQSETQSQSHVQSRSKSKSKPKSNSQFKYQFNHKPKHQRKLPIYMYKGKILEQIKTNPVTIITGQTGCGKSSQIPKYLFESGFGLNGIIACLHPRCIAAHSLAKRVSKELDSVVGDLVGYEIRFFSEKSSKTQIMFMTTGMMLQRMKGESFIDKYSVIIIDEAHERSVQTDVVMGKMKEMLKHKDFSHLRLIIMSATLDVEQIKKYYGECAVINIANTEDNIKIIYRPLPDDNYFKEIKTIVNEILKSSKVGHILIFLQSEEKVYKCRKLLKGLKNTKLLPFYASLDNDEKQLVFEEFGYRRKIIIATNVAETSLTIPGVDFVIDSGFVKRIRYDHETRVEKWSTERVSIAEANQRKGRTGRTGKGTCYRIYDEKCLMDPIEFLNYLVADLFTSSVKTKEKIVDPFKPYPEPEIQTMNLCSIVLTLKAMGVFNVMEFPFIVPPDEKNVTKCIQELTDLSMLQDDGTLTKLGDDVSHLPLEPRLGKIAIVGSQLACRSDINAIIAMLNVRNVLQSVPKSQQAYQKFAENKGDLFMLRNILFEAYANYFDKFWCKQNYINFSCIKYAYRIFEQLEWSLQAPYAGGNYLRNGYNDNLVKKVFLSGFFNNVAKRVNGVYSNPEDIEVRIHKRCSLVEKEEM